MADAKGADKKPPTFTRAASRAIKVAKALARLTQLRASRARCAGNLALKNSTLNPDASIGRENISIICGAAI